jgi:23S rRNA pseudouridine1911/1915/1917 synthase
MSELTELERIFNGYEFEFKTINVDPGQEPIRLDKYLADKLYKVSRNRIQQLIGAGGVLVNEKLFKSNYKVQPEDVITVQLPKNPDVPKEIKAEDLSLDIRYEDDDVMVVYKPPGLVVHPGVGNYTGTLVNGVLHHLKENTPPVLEGNENDRPGIVHRIDKDTSGLLVIAKTPMAMPHLAKQFFNHTVVRKYRAIVWGNFDEEEGTVDEFIGRNPKDELRMHVFKDRDSGKRAITHYKVIEDLYYVSLVECQLETGRTHQIRIHMKYLNHPIFSDEKYGGSKIVKGTVFSKYKQFVHNCFEVCSRQALHAASIGFVHPRSGEQMLFESELPEDMAEVLDKWRKYINSRKERL